MDEVTVDADMASLADAQAQRRMTEIRRIIHHMAPDVGTISYGTPTVTTGGRRLVHVAAGKQHIAIDPGAHRR
jgi:uncharacterized protein YdhG (YjbR/CyaY superfamily)